MYSLARANDTPVHAEMSEVKVTSAGWEFSNRRRTVSR